MAKTGKGQNNIVVTVSGGRSSAMMARHIQTHEKYEKYKKIYVFCNTGMERTETVQFLKNIERQWNIPLIKIQGVYSTKMGTGVSYKKVSWEQMDMEAKTFSEAIKHVNKGTYSGLPNSAAPYCSGMLKTIPCEKLSNALFGNKNYIKAIGFRREDMPLRISFPEIKKDKKRIYPLLTDFEQPITQQDLNKYWDRQPFKLAIHGDFGNCVLCWKKSMPNLIKVIKKGTKFVDWFREMEEEYGNTSFRERRSIKDLVKLAKLPATMEIGFNDGDGKERDGTEREKQGCLCSF